MRSDRGRRVNLIPVETAGRKHLYLVAYDYGTGGLWGVMRARSKAEIAGVYPELAIVGDRPQWMSQEHYARICEHEYDIDRAPWGMLNAVLADRESLPSCSTRARP